MPNSSDSYSDFAHRLTDARERREPLFRITNRLSQDPGDLDHIREYLDFLLESIDGADPVDALEYYDHLEGFLLERAEDVGPDAVDELLSLAEELDEHRQDVLAQTEQRAGTQESDPEIAATLQTWREEGVEADVPETTEDVQEKLERTRNVRALAETRGGPVPDGVERLVRRLETAIEVDERLDQVRSLIEAAEAETEVSEAAYILQSAEQVVQQLVVKRFEVGDERTKRIESTVRDLESASDEISHRKRAQQDRRKWSAFRDDHENALQEADELVPENIEGDFLQEFETEIALGTEVETGRRAQKTGMEPESNVLTQKIEGLRGLLQKIDRLSSLLQTETVQGTVEKKIEMIDNKLTGVQQRREQVYNEFALARIRRAFSEAEDAIGKVKHDKEGIADALVDYMAEVDRRYLTNEVGTCYSEVFQHLYEKLKKAKSEDDFDTEGRKLNALKRMQEREPITPEAF